ncbi:hypothetical protein [Reyranella massiliensis]|uniref:hypothetical protein n=1 Tax=Reyranella massiliensis TaxID=445220 RepID=UPI000300B363|nr:hypothetical protein [Reyranella massiliensis]
MDKRIEELTAKLDQLHAKNEALHSIVALLLGWEDKRNPLVLKSLKMLAAGDVPELVPDRSVLPSDLTPDQREQIEADLTKHRKATKIATMELATTYSLLLGQGKR